MTTDAEMVELSKLHQQIGSDEVTVCLTHRRFVPCRRMDGCQWSSEPGDVADVREWQNR